MPSRSRFQDIDGFRKRIAASRDAREASRKMVAEGRWTRIDEDPARMRDYLMRTAGRRGAEALRGVAIELQGVAFLEEGAEVARAIGKIQVDDRGGLTEGTGFLVHPGVILTNQHVIRDALEAVRATISFSYEFDRDRRPRAPTTFALAPDLLALFSEEVGGLDFALVALGPRLEGGLAAEDFGHCPLLDSRDRHLIGMPVNVIQHPQGRRKEIAIRANRLTHRTETCLLYETDTEVGSSGAPVFNDDWDVVALHHYGEPFAALGEQGGPSAGAAVNEGIRISAIVGVLKQRLPELRPAAAALLGAVLAQGEGVAAVARPRLRQPRAGESRAVRRGGGEAGAGDGSHVRVVVPPNAHTVEFSLAIDRPHAAAVSVVGAGGSAAAAPVTAGVAAAVPAILAGTEAKRLDRDYTNRKGFKEDFVPSLAIDLDAIVLPRQAQLARLKDGSKAPLKYQHFSIFIHSARRLALLTATNIDARTYKEIDRRTGTISGGSEGESWYTDTRIDPALTVRQDFYSAWSHYFDRGHLVRRTDPLFGDETAALRAHADTFHFTNCSPQHFRFNQSTIYWQGMERFVLERGVLDPAANAQRISVLQGPIFRSDDWVADYDTEDGAATLKVPGSFWKLALWKGQAGMRAFAMIASQVPLWDEERTFVSRPDDSTPIQVDQFRVSVRELSLTSGLDFAKFESIDTFGTDPVRVAERRRLVTSWDAMGL